MSSGSLPLVRYHRASHLGDGSFGSVVTVYNDDGEALALKLFLPPDDNGGDEDDTQRHPMELGALREISCLRLLRAANRHDNIVELRDVQTEWDDEDDEDDGCGGAGTAGCLGVALPLGRHGTLADAVARRTFRGYPKRAKVHVARGLLSAVAFLHDNGLIHRDIKSDNVLLERTTSEGGGGGEGDEWKPILIDFSLAKPVDGTLWGDPGLHADRLGAVRHTGEVGTVGYTAPEIVEQQAYGQPADLFSVGVVLLELLQNRALAAEKASHAAAEIEQAASLLPAPAPFPDLVRALLARDPNDRLTARQALEHPVFAKFGFPAPPGPRILNVATALPYAADDADEEENEAPPATPFQKNRQTKRMERRLQRIDRILRELGSEHPWTRAAAFEYSRQMEQVEDAIDDDCGCDGGGKNNTHSQVLADCCVLAHRMWEPHLPDLDDLEERDAGPFAHWTLDKYVDNEATIFMLLDFCLYPRSLLTVANR